MMEITVAAATDPGKRKSENEDAYAFFPTAEGEHHPKGLLLVLADGMGGRVGGATASRIAVDVVMEAYYRDASEDILASLKNAFKSANAAVIDEGEKEFATEGMATTLTAVVLKNGRMYHAHVGDSRAYTIFGDDITHFTEDHSYVASLVKAGAITEVQALTHPQRNVITKAIGIHEEVAPDAGRWGGTLKKGHYILLCCDGLYKEVPDETILETVRAHKDPDLICRKLVDKANESGGPDNITVLLARIDRVGLMTKLFGS